MIGTTISHYKILEKLGGGGMGVVYRAHDLKLDRLVALKFLPPELTLDPEAKERFVHEAKAVSSLQHHNICTIHDIDETADGQMFIVMDLYEGETLKSRIAKGQLQIEEATDIAIQIAQGLSEAHAHGIVHRDVKPANILITKSGVVKILDFGLAKLSGQSRVTKTGSTVGTAAYMSPEQAQALDVDHRTDIWSLGVVLFEMLTGKLPFRGEHEAALMYSIVHEEPQPCSTFRPEVPLGVATIVDKALQKDRTQRYQSTKEMMTDLKSALAPTIELVKPEKSIVVLPFDDLSPGRDQEYFSDGLTEEIISDLCTVRSLRVISRSSAMTLKGTKKTIPEIARQLNVQYVLEGSVRKAANDLRITAQLIDATNDTHLWAEKYSGTLDDVFNIQEKVARAITDALQVKLSPKEQQRLAERPVSDARVLECYHRARHEFLASTKESFERSLRLLHQGLDTFGEQPLLCLGLAQAHYWALECLLESRDEALTNAAEFTRRLEASDPRYSHAILAKRERAVGSQLLAIRNFEDAVAADPGDTDSLFFLALGYSVHAGRPVAGLAVAERLISNDPLTVMNLTARVHSLLADSNFAQALAVCDEMLRREPGLPWINVFRLLMLAKLGRTADACRLAEEMIVENREDLVGLQAVTMIKHALLGEREPLVASIAGELETSICSDPEGGLWPIGCFALVNERDRALQWLEHWVDRGSFNYPMLAHGDPWLQSLRGEPRFQHLLDRIRPQWEQFVPRLQFGT
jgi:non-specific serine/threonine protein kinase